MSEVRDCLVYKCFKKHKVGTETRINLRDPALLENIPLSYYDEFDLGGQFGGVGSNSNLSNE